MIACLENPSLDFSVSESHGYGNNEEWKDQEQSLWNASNKILQWKGIF